MSFVKKESNGKDVDGSFMNCNSNEMLYKDENDESRHFDDDGTSAGDDADSQQSLFFKGKNAKATLSDRLTFKLIKEYERHPHLWQKNYEGDKKTFSDRQKGYDEIANALNLSSDIVKEKLRTLRVIFYQNVKKATRTDRSGRHFEPRWRFYEALSFLQRADHDQTNNSFENASRVMQSQECLDEVDNNNLDMNTSSCMDPIVANETEDRTFSEASAEDDELKSNWQPRLHLTTSQARDFGKYVSLTLDQIEDEIILKRAKSQIQLVLSAAITEQAKKNLSSISSVNGRKHL